MGSESVIEATGLSFSFSGTPVIDSLSFRVCAGSFLTFLGPSGCGKTTLLNLIAGIYRPTSGELSVRTSRLSFVFQNEALLPWRTALDNVLLPLELAGTRVDEEARTRARRVLEDLGLAGFEDFLPSELSGGMKKRVELARALVTDPELLILDEPFSSLDIITREKLNILLRSLHRRTRCTVVMVTHSVEEACFLSDRIMAFSARPAQVIDEQHLGKNGEEPPDQFLLSPTEREAAAEIRRHARVLWAAPADHEEREKPEEEPAADPGTFMKRNYGWLLVPLELVALYFLFVFLKVRVPIPDYILPHPWGVLTRFVSTLASGSILADLGMTVYESLAGFAAAFVVTLALGYAIAKSRLLSRLLMPYLIAFNTIPSIALAPFLVLWFGFGVTPRIITSVIVIFFPMLITNISAVGLAERRLAKLLAFFRPPRWKRFAHFEFPASLPMIAGGVKVSITLSVIGAVVGEFVSGNRGLGSLVSIAKANFDVELMFVGLLWLVILGLVYYGAASLTYRVVARGARGGSR
ncbi:MAG TPA: ATP-binding cassette domain-containing protein [Spirochaetia bacterium]|nr:ATP-binding cassette domain-containing protein [Spirochaetia bacterium]